MSAKFKPTSSAAPFKMKTNGGDGPKTGKSTGSVEKPAKSRALKLADKHTPADTVDEANSVPSTSTTATDVLVTLLQDFVRTVLRQSDPATMLEIRDVFEKEIASALEAKGVCEYRGAASLVDSAAQRPDWAEIVRKMIEDSHITERESASIEGDAESQTKKSRKIKVIKGRRYLYEVSWDRERKKKRYKSLGPVTETGVDMQVEELSAARVGSGMNG